MIVTDTPYTEAVVRFMERHHYRMLAPKAALIDMDGTLYDSMPNHTAAWHRMMSELGVECTREEFYLYEGRTGASTIDELFMRSFGRHATEEEKVENYRRKTEYFRELPPVAPMAGAADMLAVLREAGLRCVLVTGSGQQSVIDRVEADFPGVFGQGMYVTAKSVTHGKPHPEPYIKGMQLARVSPSQAIVIENAPMGVEAGVRSGAFTIAVTTGPIPPEAMTEAGASVVFPSMRDFAAELPTLLLTLLTTRP